MYEKSEVLSLVNRTTQNDSTYSLEFANVVPNQRRSGGTVEFTCAILSLASCTMAVSLPSCVFLRK